MGDLFQFSNNSSNVTFMDRDELFASIEILEPNVQMLIVFLYSCTALAALSGNGAAIAVLLLGKRRSVRLFLVNLALSDVTMATFSIPFTYTDFILGRWIFLPEFCPVVQFVQHASVAVSVYTLTVVGLDRYYAIIYPLSGRWTKTRGRLVIGSIWIFSICIASVQLIHSKAERFEIGGHVFYDCNEIWDEFEGKIYTLVIFFSTFLIPLIVLSYTYGRIGYKMWARKLPGNADIIRDRKYLAANMKVVKMMAIVVALFIVCWLPIQIFGLLVHFNPDMFFPLEDEGTARFAAIFLSCHWLAMANSFVNPIIYCFMSDHFRTDLGQLLSCSRRRIQLDPRTSTFMTGSSSTKTSNVAMKQFKPSDDSFLRRPIRERPRLSTQLDSTICVRD